MAISVFNIKKWYKMLTGKSILHVNQDIGKSFSPGKITGYYNNLTRKVLMQPELLSNDKLPTVMTENGKSIYFPVAIFQYGLGAYDLYLQTGQKQFKDKFLQCCEWAIAHQEDSGAWSNFFFIYKDHPYGAMAQGEGVSLLLRGHLETNDSRYKVASKKAIDFMLLPVDVGGTTIYNSNDVIFLEYTHLSAVLNGWIFSLFGLYDAKLFFNKEKYNEIFEKSINTLVQRLQCYDNGYWSLYDLDKHLASPFYHNVHIAQMKALFILTKRNEFDEYAKKWSIYQSKRTNQVRAFCVKAYQKIIQ